MDRRDFSDSDFGDPEWLHPGPRAAAPKRHGAGRVLAWTALALLVGAVAVSVA